MSTAAPPAPRAGRRLAVPLALLVSLGPVLAAGCAVKTPATTVWSLRPPSAAAAPAARPSDGPAIGIEHFTSAAPLRTTNLTWRAEDGLRVNRYPFHEWVDYPDRMLEEAFLAELLESGHFSTVVVAPPTRGLDGVVTARVLEFQEWDRPEAIEARVAIRWSLTTPDGEVLAGGVARSVAKASRKSVEAVVEAFERASRDVLGQLEQAVKAELSS